MCKIKFQLISQLLLVSVLFLSACDLTVLSTAPCGAPVLFYPLLKFLVDFPQSQILVNAAFGGTRPATVKGSRHAEMQNASAFLSSAYHIAVGTQSGPQDSCWPCHRERLFSDLQQIIWGCRAVWDCWQWLNQQAMAKDLIRAVKNK